MDASSSPTTVRPLLDCALPPKLALSMAENPSLTGSPPAMEGSFFRQAKLRVSADFSAELLYSSLGSQFVSLWDLKNSTPFSNNSVLDLSPSFMSSSLSAPLSTSALFWTE